MASSFTSHSFSVSAACVNLSYFPYVLIVSPLSQGHYGLTVLDLSLGLDLRLVWVDLILLTWKVRQLSESLSLSFFYWGYFDLCLQIFLL